MKQNILLIFIASFPISLFFAQTNPLENFVTEGSPKHWAISTGAFLSELRGDSHSLLACRIRSKANIEREKKSLSEWWGVESKKDLLDSLKWVEEEGHRASFEEYGKFYLKLTPPQFQTLLLQNKNNKEETEKLLLIKKHYKKLGKKSLLGWDLSRYVLLCRWGYLSGYFTADEAWHYLFPVAYKLQQTFDSWKELGENYIIGRAFWDPERAQRDQYAIRRALRKLLQNPESPWKICSWKMNLKTALKEFTIEKIKEKRKKQSDVAKIFFSKIKNLKNPSEFFVIYGYDAEAFAEQMTNSSSLNCVAITSKIALKKFVEKEPFIGMIARSRPGLEGEAGEAIKYVRERNKKAMILYGAWDFNLEYAAKKALEYKADGLLMLGSTGNDWLEAVGGYLNEFHSKGTKAPTTTTEHINRLKKYFTQKSPFWHKQNSAKSKIY